MGKGSSEAVKEIIDLPGTMHDRHGNPGPKIVLKDTLVCKNSNFNLFSITKAIAEGWILTNEGTNTLVLSKGGMQL